MNVTRVDSVDSSVVKYVFDFDGHVAETVLLGTDYRKALTLRVPTVGDVDDHKAIPLTPEEIVNQACVVLGSLLLSVDLIEHCTIELALPSPSFAMSNVEEATRILRVCYPKAKILTVFVNDPITLGDDPIEPNSEPIAPEATNDEDVFVAPEFPVPCRLENWAMVQRDPYQAPELADFSLTGKVYGHPGRHEDGKVITSSRIRGKSGDCVLTWSGSRYLLGEPAAAYEELYPNARKRLFDTLPEVS